MTGTALVPWRQYPINPRKPKKVTRTVCEVLRELYRDAETRGDHLSMQRIDEAHDMAKRMDKRLQEYARTETSRARSEAKARGKRMKEWSVFIGFEPRETEAFAVARSTARNNLFRPVKIRGIVLDEMRRKGLYTRPTEVRDGRLFDVISDHPMATEFAISRFLTPHLAEQGLALFMDCDMLVRANLDNLFDAIDESKAVTVVKHDFRPANTVKMDNQVQTHYARKNWSSVMVFNCDHPANRKLTLDLINTAPGRDLHRFCWLEDADIGEVGCEWNWLAGHSPTTVEPKIVHHTDGVPTMAGYENAPYADEWRAALYRWAA